jgi:hypothetical protein
MIVRTHPRHCRGTASHHSPPLILLCIVALCATGCGGLPVGTEQGIKSGATVQAFRLDPAAPRGSPTDPQTLDGYRVVAGPVQLSPDAANRLTTALTDRYTYKTSAFQPDCPFQPLVGFRYPASPHPVDVIVAFPCKEARFVRWTRDGSRPDDKDEDIAGGYYELVNVSKQAFPSDSTVQALDPGKPGGRWAK